MNSIKNKIFKLLDKVEIDKVDYNDLENLLKIILSEDLDQESIYAFLDLLHFSNVSKLIADNDSNYWALKISDIIKKYNFHTGQLLFQRAKRYKEKPALITIDGENKKIITYNKLWSDLVLCAKSINSISKDKTIKIGVLSANQYKSALIDLCCLSFGYRVIPIPLNSTSEHLSYILNETEINVLFIGGEKAVQLWNAIHKYHNIKIVDINDIRRIKGNSISWEYFQDLGEKNNNINYELNIPIQDMKWTTTIMYTSGSTSNPKGVKFNQINIISKRFARALALPKINSNDLFLCYLPLFHTFGRYFELMGSIFWGATYAFAESPSFNSLLKDFKLVKPSIFISIPKRWVQMYDLMNDTIDLDLSSKKSIKNKLGKITGGNLQWGLSAAGYLDPDVFKFFHDYDIELISGYGMTESTGGITMTPPNEYIINSVGKALPGIKLKLADDGELCMKGPYVSDGFYKIKDTDSFKDGWFHSGDIFEKKDGHFFIIDRKKDIYKNSRGQTIAPQKIENLFQDFDLVKSVFLVGDGKEYNTVLIYPNKDNHEYDIVNMNDVQVREIFSAMLISVNGFLSPFERIVNFSIIKEDFSIKKNELTQKGTFKRKNVLSNYRQAIDQMYKKDYVSLYNEEKEIKFPNWLIREIGTIKSNVKWDGNKILIIDKNLSLPLRWGNKTINIGNFSYNVKGEIFDLESFIKCPKLWLGNQKLVEFCSKTIFRVKDSTPYPEININNYSFKESKNTSHSEFNSDLHLETLHYGATLYLSNNISFSKYLHKIINQKNNEWTDVIIDTFMQYQNHPNPLFRIKLLETISPILSDKLFVDQLRSHFKFLKQNSNSEKFNFDIEHISKKQYTALISLLKTMHASIDTLDRIDMNFIQDVLSIICEYGKRHPTKFISARSELIWWQLSKSPTKILSTAQKEYYNLINGFRIWLGPNTSLTIDRETKKEYTWKEVVVFDDNVRNKHKKVLLKSISDTALIKEAIFLFTNDTILQLADIPQKGVWIKHIATKNGKSSFRVLVKTLSFGTYNIVINLNHDLDRAFFEDEIRWLIQMGESSSKQGQLVEKFGGYWPEQSIYTEEYITDETVSVYLERNKEEIRDLNKRDRWQMRWLHYIWNGAQAYIDFWHRTDYKLAIDPPVPDNLIIPRHDYTIGTRIISISDRKKIKSVGKFYLDLYINYIIKTENTFSGLKHMADWELIFTASLEAMKVKKGIPILKNLQNDLDKKEYKNKFNELGLTKDRINSFIKDFEIFGVLTKPVVFAALRYERWLDLNQEAKNEAKASILKELYHDYHLNSLLDEYPETRVRYFMMTSLKNSGEELNKYFQSIIKDMRLKILSPWDLKDRIEYIIENANLDENEKFFLARMLYPHIDAADFAELVKMKKGENHNLDLVIKTEDSSGRIYSIRPPFHPKEIAKFQTIISKENLSATFEVNHKFLFIMNERNSVIGGLYYKIKNNLRVHLEWVVIQKKYQQLDLSKRLMEDFFNRMRQNGIDIVTVGFYHENFFYKQGFNIDQSYGGLVKIL